LVINIWTQQTYHKRNSVPVYIR